MVERTADQTNRSLERGQLIEAANQLVPILRAADVAAGEDRSFADFDLAQPLRDKTAQRFVKDEPTKEEASEIVSALVTCADAIQRLHAPEDNPSLTMQREFLLAKLEAYQTFIGHKYLGEEIPHPQYIERIMGIKPEEISEEALVQQRERVANIFAGFGGEYTEEGIQAYKEEQHISPEEFEQILKEKADMFLGMLQSFLGREFEPPKYEVELVDKDEYWFNWAGGIRGEYILKVNHSEERHLDKFTPGKAEAMALHEITGHFAQMINWQRAIDQNRLLAPLGITSVVDPEQISSEGIAETLHYFVPQINEALSPEARYELEVEGLRQMAYNNVHTKIAEGSITQSEVLGYVRNYCPAETGTEAARQYEERSTHAVKKAYLYAYGMGFLVHRYYAQILNRDERRSFLRLLYRQPLTPIQERDYAFELSDNLESSEPDATGGTQFLHAA